MSTDRKPSSYQAAIVDWIRSGGGDAIVEAVAGSGKTTTLELGWSEVRRRAPTARAIFLAFNRSVASELGARLHGLETRTLHSLGNRPTRRALGDGTKLDQTKYSRLAANHLASHATGKDKDNWYLASDLARIASLARMSLTDTNDEHALRQIAEWHNIGRGFGRVERYIHLVPSICQQGLHLARTGVIDFTDQLWLPAVLGLPVPQYDWVFIDESQDLNLAQFDLVKRSRSGGGRLLFVGDPAQAIYGFAGADSSSLKKIERDLCATTLPLSVTYRCARSHVDAARQIVPAIEARAGAPDGKFEELSIWEGLEMMSPDDMILSREVAPAVAVQRHLDERSRSAFVDDRERWKELRRLLERYRHDCIAADDLEAHLAAIVERADSGGVIGDYSRLDAIRSLLFIIAGGAETYDGFQRAVDRVFAPREIAARCLTIHKAKGLEASRVFLIRPDLLPHRFAERQWQRVQEENLLYVALTRAKHELYVCHGELPLHVMSSTHKLSPLEGGRGVWGTNFTFLRGQSPSRPPSSGASKTKHNPYERQHYFHDGICVHCEKPESLVRSFGWKCR